METLSIARRKFRSGLVRIRRYFFSQRFGLSPDVIYQAEFYDGPGFLKTRQSAESIAAFVQSHLAPKDVLDIGCGSGEYLRAMFESGIAAIGCDGASSGIRRAGSTSFAFVHDLKKPLVTNRTFDLVMCIEVAEHLPKSSAATLVASICRNAKHWILFTAAPPEASAGDDHINCQPIEYWSAIFATHGFHLDPNMTARLREHSRDNDLAMWWKVWSCIYRMQ